MIHYYLFRILAAINLNTDSLPNSDPNAVDVPTSFLGSLLQIVFGVTGSVALLMVVISGFRYIIASGEPAAVARARSTILYAVIGLAVALAGFSIVTFVVMRVA